jgi:hypothetical protein
MDKYWERTDGRGGKEGETTLEENIKRIKEGGGGILACMANYINIIPYNRLSNQIRLFWDVSLSDT